jgi:hypothetical protein
MVAQVGYSVAVRSRGRVAPCAVCTGHVETSSAGFSLLWALSTVFLAVPVLVPPKGSVA